MRYISAPASRNTDPLTSHEAEGSINEDGTRKTQCDTILRRVRDAPGSTAGDIADMTGLGMHITSRRLADLKNDGLAYQGQPRIWEGSGRRQVSWWPVVTPVQGELGL